MKSTSQRMLPWLAGAVLLALLLAPGSLGAASERILSFRSLVEVHTDSSMTVTENITVQSDRREIRHGIVRDFPTTYRDRRGRTVKVDFEVREVLRDGQPEPYHIQSVTQGEKIFVGRKDVLLPPGVYTYTIRYTTGRQLGYFPKLDELYWNVTGNGWTFPIDAVEAVIVLPPGAKPLQHAAYTGPQGGKGQDFKVSNDSRGNLVFTTTRGLGRHEGLTVAVAWPKGVVQPPSGKAQTIYFLRDNAPGVAGLLWLVIILGYYLAVWFQAGRDPAKGTVVPLYSPPTGFSPAGVRFLSRMGFDHKTLASSVVDLAVKGALQIEEAAGSYTLIKKKDDAPALTEDEHRVLNHLFLAEDSLELKSENHSRVKETLDVLKETLKKELEQIYFVTNRASVVAGAVLSLLALGSVVLVAPNRGQAAGMALWLGGWTVACGFLAVRLHHKWEEAHGLVKIIGALFLTVATLYFFAFELVGVGMFGVHVSGLAALPVAALAVINPLFYHLLKAPTLAGRQVMDRIEGFKLFLSVAEKERLNLLNPPDKTPELFEKYLPYALALDVENAWSEQFAGVLEQAGEKGQPYHSGWYSGSSGDMFDSSRFASDLGTSFSDAISAASSAPGSDMGSGGGGDSGGGGGGGGGSGW